MVVKAAAGVANRSPGREIFHHSRCAFRGKASWLNHLANGRSRQPLLLISFIRVSPGSAARAARENRNP
jgi:hypothetical protein